VKSYHEIVGDGGSGVIEQLQALHAQIGRALSGVKSMIAVGSGKGGVGKSTVAHGIASALQSRGRRVAILDADINGPSQARLAGLGAAPLVPGADGVLQMPRDKNGIGVVSVGTLVPEIESVEFDSVSEGESHTWRATREFAFMAQLLSSIGWGQLDYLMIDLPPGAERTFQYAEFFGAETEFVLVTTPSALSRGVVQRSVAALARTPNPVLGYIENMSGYYCADCDSIKPLFAEAAEVEFGMPCLGRIPFDPLLSGDDPSAHADKLFGEIAGVLDARSRSEED
jgi:ATP-binding protein involved in chromosome partitioning